MIYRKFIIECNCKLSRDVIIDYIDWFSNTIEFINDYLIFIDAPYSLEELNETLIYNNLNAEVVDITYKLPESYYRRFDSRIINNINNLIKKADISEDINYFLDLINERGGTKYLSGKEYQRLVELGGNHD